MEPGIRERDDLRMLEAANISIIAALTKMSLSASSIWVTLLFSFFIHPWANLFLNKNKGRTRIDWQFKPAYVAASRMANIFSIPPTSTESKRVFSGARRTISLSYNLRLLSPRRQGVGRTWTESVRPGWKGRVRCRDVWHSLRRDCVESSNNKKG